MASWTSTINPPNLVNFTSELALDHKSLGSLSVDFNHFCTKFSIIKCPSFSIGNLPNSRVFVKLINREIDLSNWRAMLLACAAIGSTVSEICLHNVQLSSQHLIDLSLAIEKIGSMTTLKLDYIQFVDDDQLITPAISQFQPIFNCNGAISYISCKGCKLTDEFITNIYSNLVNHPSLTYLNLSDNSLTDAGINSILHALRYNQAIQFISLKHNLCTGTCLTSLGELLSGIISTPDDDDAFKTLSKVIADKNKTNKDVNKKRKKAGLTEYDEIPGLKESRIIKLDKKGPHYLNNRTIRSIDLSWNAVATAHILAMAEIMSTNFPIIQAVADPCSFSLSVKGCISSADEGKDALQQLVLIDGVSVISF